MTPTESGGSPQTNSVQPTRACPQCKHTSIIGVEVSEEWDGVLYWQCESCRFAWQRFSKGDFRHQRAAKYLDLITPRASSSGGPPEETKT